MACRCIICLEDGTIKHTFPCTCSGFFHEPCLQNWYRQTGSHTCPICRIPFRQYRVQEPERIVTYNPVYTPPQTYVPPQNYSTIPISPAPSPPPYPVIFQNMTPTERTKRIIKAICLGGMLMIPFAIFYVAMRDRW